MSRGSVSIDVRDEGLIDVRWMVLVDGRVVSLDGERRVSFDELTSFGVDRWRASLFVD